MPGLGRGLLNLLAMFVEPGEKEHVTSTQPPVARQHVGGNGGVGVSDMRHVVHVVDRRRDVKGLWCAHGLTKRYQVDGEDARQRLQLA